MCGARPESALSQALPVPAGDWTGRVGWLHLGLQQLHELHTGGDQRPLFCHLPWFLNAKSCPQIEIVSSRCCSRTRSLLFPAQYLNFSGGWCLIDVAISFYSTSVKSKLPSQCCCSRDSSRKAAEQWSQGRGMVGGGQGGRQPQISAFVWSSKHANFSNCKAASFVPVCPCASATAPGSEQGSIWEAGAALLPVTRLPVSHEKHISAAP